MAIAAFSFLAVASVCRPGAAGAPRARGTRPRTRRTSSRWCSASSGRAARAGTLAQDDPLRVRLGPRRTRMPNLTRALRRYRMTDDVQRIAVVADLKRMSPTAAASARRSKSRTRARADAVAAWPVDAIMINTDGFSYGGSATTSVARASCFGRAAPQFVARELDLLARSANVDVGAGRDPSGSWTGSAAAPPPPPPSDEEDPTRPPAPRPVIMKDIVLHPLQVAQAQRRARAPCTDRVSSARSSSRCSATRP